MRSISSTKLYGCLAGLAAISLIGIQLTSDIDDYDSFENYANSDGLRARRQLEVTVDDVQLKLDLPTSTSTDTDTHKMQLEVHRQLQQKLDENNIQHPLVRELPVKTVSGVSINYTLAPNAAPDFEPLDYDSLGTSFNISLDDIDDACQMSGILGPNEIPEDVEFKNTIIVGYPGADKRTVLRQMEAMTTLSGRDSWDLAFLGLTDQPFIKTNYPHHEGIYGWDKKADQVVLVVRNIRWAINDYHDILADIDYAKTWAEATEKIPMLYKGTIFDVLYYVSMIASSVVSMSIPCTYTHSLFQAWRDERTMDE